MIVAVLLATAAPAAAATPVPQSAIEAERAFAADARKIGQWTAFRKWSTPGAKMFVPQPTNAHAFLNGRKDPPASVQWSPLAGFTSCDGTLGATYGPWRRPDGSQGHFFTIWQRRVVAGNAQWRWLFDAGQRLEQIFPATARPIARRAACSTVPAAAAAPPLRPKTWGAVRGTSQGGGMSTDRTLHWTWSHSPEKGTWLSVAMWNGKALRLVMDVQAAAPK